MPKPINAFVFYRGPSMLDGQPIIAVATGLNARGSRNEKTGSLIQTWIIREDISPQDAAHSGADVSVCGDCPHRGRVVDGRNVGRSCYVKVFQAPLSVYKGFHRGIYTQVSPEAAGELLAGRLVRLGSYGDPAAIPFAVWQALLVNVKAKTGYTHQWRSRPELKAYCMASCDTAADFEQAKAMGWRTFRVRLAGDELQPREIVCPASLEAGKKTSCADCRACGGLTSKAKADIAIIAHGASNVMHAYAALRAQATQLAI